MTDLLFGSSLNWTSWDPRNVLTAMLQSILAEWAASRAIKLRLIPIEELAEYERVVATQAIGLAVWAVWEDALLEQVCASLASVRAHRPGPVGICYLAPELAEQAAILAESGAQIVVCQLPSLQMALPGLLQAAPLSSHGYHPLTSGLVERLPWANVIDSP